MSILERKLFQKQDLIPFLPPTEPKVEENIPPRQHAFETWQMYINTTFQELSNQTYSRCVNQCKYDVALMGGRKTPINELAEFDCAQDCGMRWLSPFTKYTEMAHAKAEREFERCIKNDNHFDLETKDLLECKRTMFNSYMDSILDYEQEYLKQALEKYS
jgi:hypothetical protein